jgi:hypothetical protein
MLQKSESLDPCKPEFNANVKGVHTFGRRESFKTVFAGGEDAIEEE